MADALIREKLFDMVYLSEEYEITQDHLKGFYEFARFQFGCGNYSKAADYLAYFRLLSTNQEKQFSALWGKFAAEILMQRWDLAMSDMKQLQHLIETRVNVSPVVQLQQRTWLIHWSLFVFFNHPNGRNGIIELFMNDKYLNAIQTSCPHVLRYLATAVITNKRKRNVLRDIVKVIRQESYTYKDPITEFLECLYLNFDFETAQAKLKECEKVLDNDFFLVACCDEFLENARLFIFETYCRIHECIDISMLAEKLNMNEEQAERWIVNLVRSTHLEAKIDSANNQVILNSNTSNMYVLSLSFLFVNECLCDGNNLTNAFSVFRYQQVIDKTKGMCYKTYEMSNALQKLGN